MRLICPGCGAQYEVDDGVIPDGGRDVQCSSCGHVWYQKSRPILLSEDEAIPVADHDWEAEDGVPAASDEDLQLAIDALASDRQGAGARTPEASSESAPAPVEGTRRSLDDNLLAILREEAEREAEARRADSDPFETQSEMNLEPVAALAARKSLDARATDNKVQVTKPLAEPLRASARTEVAPADATRADPLEHSLARSEPLRAERQTPRVEPVRNEPLPDVSTINSSLRASTDRTGDDAFEDLDEDATPDRAGFRLGFFSVILFAILAAAIYLNASRIVDSIPDVGPALQTYVAKIDEGRVWLDGVLRPLLGLKN